MRGEQTSNRREQDPYSERKTVSHKTNDNERSWVLLSRGKHIAAYLRPWLTIPIFMWIGFVCSISFMEAWLKFQAPNVSLPIGLGIGKLIFTTLNKTEWILCGMIMALIFPNNSISKFIKYLSIIPIFILVLQTSWLLPVLNQRAETIIEGKTVGPSFVHFYYMIFDITKVLTLFTIGFFEILMASQRQVQAPLSWIMEPITKSQMNTAYPLSKK